MSFKINKPSQLRKNNTQLKYQPPIKRGYQPPVAGLFGSILKPNLYAKNNSFVVGDLSGNKIIPNLTGGSFGWSVDCDKQGVYTVVGAPLYNNNIGFAKIYKIQNNIATLLYTTTELQDADHMIGFSVAISGNGNVIAVGVPGYNSNIGGVLIYNNVNGVISYSTFLTPNMISDNYAGQSLKLNYDGTILAIGAPLAQVASVNDGKAWIYKKTGSSWNLIQTIESDDFGIPSNQYFAESVDMTENGDKIIFSSKTISGYNVRCYANIFNYSSTTGRWVYSKSVSTSITTSIGLLSNVDIDVKISDGGRYVVISSPNDAPEVSGVVSVNTLSSNDVVLYSTTLDKTSNDIGFGYKVAISGDCKTIYVSSIINDANQGEIWIYRQSEEFPTSWIRVLEPFRGINELGDSQQGFSIDCSYDGSVLVIGGILDNSGDGATWSFI